MRVEDLTKFEEECPTIVVFNTYMDIRVPLTKKWKKIINERGDKPNTYHNCLISYISEQIALFLLLIRNLRCINAKEIDTSVKTRVNISMFVQERFLKIRKSHYENGCWLVILLLK